MKRRRVKRPHVKIHESVSIEEPVEIGEGTTIWHHSQVLAGAKIGRHSTIGHNCFVSGRAVIGNEVKLESNIDVWDLVTLEDGVFVGPSAVFTNDLTPRARFPKAMDEWVPTYVREGATIGANATILCGITMGKYAFVGAGSVVTKDIPDYALVVGNPARQIGWVCECGKTLTFKGKNARCSSCQRAYKREGLKVTIKDRSSP